MTTQDNCAARVSPSDASNSSSNKLRRKRKWDQPAESLISSGLAVPGVFPLGNVGSLVGIALPGVAPVSGTFQQGLIAPSLQQHAAAMVQKITQTKIQEELIAREIVINDAESSIRYMLTKRQTQEEIQKCTGSVVITRGKYRPPNGPPDGEKPLYLHISAGAHLETTADRIKAVDRAADMVEQMLKQGSLANGPKPLSTCVFLGFEADPSLNIVARIRGPNDQYVNHIMNETGATVLLRGRDSENSESSQGEEELQPLHLFLSSNNPKSLEHAKLLAENLLDTICAECGACRVSSCKVYGAVPPPHQLLTVPPTTTLTVGTVPVAAVPSATVPLVTTFPFQGTIPNIGGYSQPTVTGHGTNYNGYCGIYPQATPLPQVALALRQSVSSVTSTVSPVAATTSTASFSSTNPSEREKRRRKFQELPVTSKVPAVLDQNLLQDSEFSKPQLPKSNVGERNISNMPSPKKLRQQSVDGFTPPPPRNMLPPLPPRSMPPTPPPPRSMPPPPPPKFNSSPPVLNVPKDSHVRSKVNAEVVPDTLIQLMEYGDVVDEDEETSGRPLKSDSNLQVDPQKHISQSELGN